MNKEKQKALEAAGWKIGNAADFLDVKPVKDAPMQAMKNAENLQGTCGCFKCISVFEREKIVEFTDQNRTALCPECGSDTVIQESSPDVLQKTKDYWFQKE